ncbi:MAG TPA: hypothetical protein PK530_03080 [Anaerolineales bacterium]|nr:hypothetical protein [Anaerolineales bacterium]
MYRKLVITISVLIVLLLGATIVSIAIERFRPTPELAQVLPPTATTLQGMASNGAIKSVTPTVDLPAVESTPQVTPTPEPVVVVFPVYLPIVGTGGVEASLFFGTVNP